MNDKQKEYYLKNKPKINKYYRDWRLKQRKELLALLGDKCVRCGFDDWRALQVDHINGGGNKENDGSNPIKYYRSVVLEIKSGSTKYQLLCANCNWIKKYENNENSKRS